MIARGSSRPPEDGPRPYRIVVLSDHGQSQGATFLQRQGKTLGEFVEELAGSKVAEAPQTDEGMHNINTALTESTQGSGSGARATKAILSGASKGGVELGHRPEDRLDQGPAVLALASGCLGLVYFTDHDRRLTREQLDELFPGLLDGLIANPDVGFALVATESDGAVVLGPRGARYLDGDRVEGADPLADYPATAAQHLRRTNGFGHAPDILCNGRFDPATGEVPAFEELVGSHGGLGGTQAQPFLLHPSDLEAPEGDIVGAETMNHALRPWAESAMAAGRAKA